MEHACFSGNFFTSFYGMGVKLVARQWISGLVDASLLAWVNIVWLHEIDLLKQE